MEKYDQLLEASRNGPVASALLAEVESTRQAADLEFLVEEIPKAIQQSLEGTERVSKIVRSMKDFAYLPTKEKAAADLNKAIESTITVAHNEWKYVADMVTNFDPNLPLVPCLLGDLNQVFLNLIVNASHAIGDVVGKTEGQKGTITVSTRLDGDWAEIRVGTPARVFPKQPEHGFSTPSLPPKSWGKGPDKDWRFLTRWWWRSTEGPLISRPK
jgi:signal transduction histidine kinase